jgi:hypothetical protein
MAEAAEGEGEGEGEGCESMRDVSKTSTELP